MRTPTQKPCDEFETISFSIGQYLVGIRDPIWTTFQMEGERPFKNYGLSAETRRSRQEPNHSLQRPATPKNVKKKIQDKVQIPS